MALTLTPGTLIVASAYPDPPFDLIDSGSPSGFDIELMRAICAQLGLVLQPVRYSGDDFNGIFGGLANRSRNAPPSRCFRSLISNSTKESRSIGARCRTSCRSPQCEALQKVPGRGGSARNMPGRVCSKYKADGII